MKLMIAFLQLTAVKALKRHKSVDFNFTVLNEQCLLQMRCMATSGMKMETVCFPETLASSTEESTRSQNPEDRISQSGWSKKSVK